MITFNTLSCSFNLFCHINFDYIFLFLIPFALVIVVNELLDKYTKLPREFHRKFGHIISGLTIVAASYHLGFIEMILFSLALIAGALGTRVLHLASVHKVTRKSIGTTLFAVVTLILTLLWFRENPELLRYGIWILTIPDALAALIGSQWGTYLERWGKSYLGSFVFFIATCVVTLAFIPFTVWPVVLMVALVLTMMEFFTIWGLDNLTLPILGSVMLFFLI